MKQEELEKAAEKYGDDQPDHAYAQICEAFEAGAKWHEQQGYLDAISLVEYITAHYCYLNPKRIVNEWLKERESKCQ